jgi:hypothetical protein
MCGFQPRRTIRWVLIFGLPIKAALYTISPFIQQRSSPNLRGVPQPGMTMCRNRQMQENQSDEHKDQDRG